MRVTYHFNTEQNISLVELLEEMDILNQLLTNLSTLPRNCCCTHSNLPDNLSPEHRAMVEIPVHS